MPRRGGGRVSSPSRTPNLPARHAPPPPPAPIAASQPRQPGLLGQMAATAGGVAIGSTVGHVVGHAMTGGMSGGGQAPAEQQNAAPQQQRHQNPCQQHLQSFLECANKNSHDLSLCYGFNEALKECKFSYGMQ